MCQISNKIRFCTCKVKNISKLKHYWALYRFDPNKKLFILGETYLPILDDLLEINQTTLLDVLNNQNPFDVELNFENKDKFVLELFHDEYEARKSYTFVYRKNKWRVAENDVFDLMNNYDELQYGKVKRLQ